MGVKNSSAYLIRRYAAIEVEIVGASSFPWDKGNSVSSSKSYASSPVFIKRNMAGFSLAKPRNTAAQET